MYFSLPPPLNSTRRLREVVGGRRREGRRVRWANCSPILLGGHLLRLRAIQHTPRKRPTRCARPISGRHEGISGQNISFHLPTSLVVVR